MAVRKKTPQIVEEIKEVQIKKKASKVPIKVESPDIIPDLQLVKPRRIQTAEGWKRSVSMVKKKKKSRTVCILHLCISMIE